MSARNVPLALLALALTSAACQPPAQEAGPLSEEDIAVIRARADSYAEAMLAHDWAAVASGYTEDAVMMAPNEPLIEGRAAIQASYEAMPITVTGYTNTPVEIDGRGDLAYVRGVISATGTIEGMPAPVSDTIKYLAVVRKQPDGAWLTTHVSWNSDLPLPGASPES
jgi:ketosteroid isomerase-like protein